MALSVDARDRDLYTVAIVSKGRIRQDCSHKRIIYGPSICQDFGRRLTASLVYVLRTGAHPIMLYSRFLHTDIWMTMATHFIPHKGYELEACRDDEW